MKRLFVNPLRLREALKEEALNRLLLQDLNYWYSREKQYKKLNLHNEWAKIHNVLMDQVNKLSAREARRKK